MASAKPQSPAMEFLLDQLKKDRKASYADIKAKADEKKLKLFPIMYGRAQLLLGIVKGAKRGTGKAAKASAAKRAGKSTAAPAARGRGRQPDANSKSGQIRELLKSGMAPMDIAKKVKCTPALVYNVKARLGGGGGSAPAKRGPGRPPKSASSGGGSSMDGLAGILDMVKNSDRERAALRTALEKIQAVIEGVLA